MRNKWLQLTSGLGLIILFLLGLARLTQAVPTLRQLQEAVTNQDSDHGALYYTESETAKAAVRRLGREIKK